MRGFIWLAIPLLIAAATPAMICCAQIYMSDGFYGAKFELAFAFGMGVFAVALLHAVILGLPAYFLVKHFDLTKWWMSLLCGVTIGALPSFLLDGGLNAANWTPLYRQQHLRVWLEAGSLGMAGGFAAWLTWYLLGRCMAAPRPVK